MDHEHDEKIVEEVEQLRTQLKRQNSLGRVLVVGVVYGIGFFVGSAILATIAFGIFGPWFGQVGWIRSSYEAGSQLLHTNSSSSTTPRN